MDTIQGLKAAAHRAMGTEDGSGDLIGFLSIVNPQSVLELVQIAETRLTDEEVQALHQVIAELSAYIRRTAPAPEGLELLDKAKQIVRGTTRNSSRS